MSPDDLTPAGSEEPVDPEGELTATPAGDPLAAPERSASNQDVAGSAEDQPAEDQPAGLMEATALAATPIDPAELQSAVEAILFVVESPVTISSLAAAVQQPTDAVAEAVARLRVDYDERAAGIELREVAGGVRVYTRPAHAAYVEAFLHDGQRSRLTQAALETLAVIAYRQPVTRARVSAIRGVNVDGVVRTLASRGLIVEVGSDPDTGGGLYQTTALFLERMGLQTLDELPSLAPLLPEIDNLEAEST